MVRGVMGNLSTRTDVFTLEMQAILYSYRRGKGKPRTGPVEAGVMGPISRPTRRAYSKDEG